MKSREEKFVVSAMSLAVRGAVLAMCATPLASLADEAANEELNALIKPASTIEIGAQYLPKDASKFGEYSGLNREGGYLIGNFNFRGGDSYGMGEGIRRWELYGTDLGTNSRGLGALVSDQGQWSIGLDYDQLRHYTTGGTYETPYQGEMGGNTFILPPSFGVTPTATPGTRYLDPITQQPFFKTQDVYTERKETSFKLGYNINPRWDFKFDFSRLEQSGAKLISSATDAYGGGAATGGFAYSAEANAVLMNPTSYQTDAVNMGLNWVGERAFVSTGYYGSYFHDNFNGLSWSSPFGVGVPQGTSPGTAFQVNTMSTPPSNDFHQINLSGGYNFAPATKLVGGLSYGRNTQNATYVGTYTTTPNMVPGLPVASLGGLVITTHADLKLTHQATNALGLMAALKYNERDNQTDSNTYQFYHLAGVAAANLMTVVNIPVSNRRYQFELGADYRITAAQKLRVGYEREKISRWCENDLANNARGVNPTGQTAAAYYAGGASCVQVPESTEDKLSVGYKLKATETIDFNAGYLISRRKAEVNTSFYSPLQSRASGYENYGFLAFFDASRRQSAIKAGVNWQATERLAIGLNGRYSRDDYDSMLGVQDGNAESANLDATYNFSENYTVGTYLSWQHRERDLLSANGRNAVADTLPNRWTNNLTDDDKTVGINATQKGFLGGKLEFAEDLTYSIGRTRYTTASLYYNAFTGVGAVGTPPDILSELTQLRLTGTYQVDRASKVIMGYTFQHLNSDDYMYNGYQYGYTPSSMLPTNQQSPNYIVNTIYAAYQYSFR